MGIKDLNKLLNEKCQSIQISLVSLRGKRVALDFSNILYKQLSLATKNIVNITDIISEEPSRAKIIDFTVHNIWQLYLKRFLENNITPVIVLDGIPPSEKTVTKTERHAKKESARNQIRTLKSQINVKDPLALDNELLTKLRKLYNQWIYVSEDEMFIFKTFFNGLGIPVLQCKEEAERLCANLCRRGYVSCVYSTDTDTITHGCPYLIKEFLGSKDGNSMVEVWSLDIILKDLQLSLLEFVDLCIMAGSDYNKNIYRVGIKRSYELICKHKSIDQLPDKYDTKVLNHQRGRELFQAKPVGDLVEDFSAADLNLNLDFMRKQGRSLLDTYQLSGYLDLMVKLMDNIA